jgi:hypothetical protein
MIEAISQSPITAPTIRNWRPEDAEQIYAQLESKCWVPWLRTEPDTFRRIAEIFPRGQHLVEGIDGELRASLTTNRIHWSGNPDTLTTWDQIASGDASDGDYSETYDPNGNTLVLMSMNVAPGFHGAKYPMALMERVLAEKQNGIEHVISPFRPTDYGKAKLKSYREGFSPISFAEYCNLTREDGMPEDAWLRNLNRNGMQVIKVQPDSMRVEVSVEQLHEYMRTVNPDSWIARGRGRNRKWECGEVGTWTIENGIAVYNEENIWGEIIDTATKLPNPNFQITQFPIHRVTTCPRSE